MSKLLRYLVIAQKAVIVLCSLLIAVTFGIVVVLRYLFEANLFAYEEWMLVAAFLLYFIGAAQGSYDNSHIKADLLNEWIKSPRTRRRYAIATLGLEIAIGAVLTYWGFLMVAEDLAKYPELPATPVYKIPLAVPLATIFLGFFLMTLYSLMHMLRLLHEPTAGHRESKGDAAS